MESNGWLYVLADPDIPWQGSRDVYGFQVLRTTRKFFASTGIKRIRGKDRRARAVPIPFGAARPPCRLAVRTGSRLSTVQEVQEQA